MYLRSVSRVTEVEVVSGKIVEMMINGELESSKGIKATILSGGCLVCGCDPSFINGGKGGS